MRLPIVMANANRALSAPINIHCDHSRHHGRARHGLDHPVRRDRAGGLRQHDHRRAHRRAPRRAAAGHDLPRRLHHHALDRPRRRSWTTRRSTAFVGELRARVRAARHRQPGRRHGNFAGLGGPYFEFKKLAAHRDRPLRCRSSSRSAPSGPRSPAARSSVVEGWGMEDAEIAIVVIGSTAGNARHVARELRAEGVKAGVAQDPRASARSPLAEIADGAQGRQGRRGARPLRVASAPRAGRSSSRSAARSTTSRAACRVVDYIYGLGGAT